MNPLSCAFNSSGARLCLDKINQLKLKLYTPQIFLPQQNTCNEEGEEDKYFY